MIAAAWARARTVPGHLTEREGRFLALLAAGTPASGAILEIGSFKGKSTVVLGTVAQRGGLGPVVAVDPHSAPSVTDPDIGAARSTWEEFQDSLRRAELATVVEAHRAYSRDLARDWNRPIRLLWIDGDHTYAGAKQDLELFGRWVTPGGIVAFHDVLNTFDGPVRVFAEELLGSDRFGPAGLCGSIGWAQYRPEDGARWSAARAALRNRVARLIPFVQGGREPRGMRKLRYKVHRALVPHRAPEPDEWLRMVSA